VWSTEESIETTASPEAIWRLWADVPRWPDWIADIEPIEISGPFAAGSMISMTPIGQAPVELLIEEAIEPERFIDVALSSGPFTASRASTTSAAGSSTAWRSPAQRRTA
jgi:hypothetical protein